LWYMNNQKYYKGISKKSIVKRLGVKKWLKKELF